MKATKLFAMAILASGLIFSSCKKDESSSNNNTPSAASNLTGKDWRMTGLTLTSPGGTVDMWAAMDPCDRDDLFWFATDNTVTIKAGATKCDPTDPDTTPGGTWALMNGDTKLRIIDGDTTDMDVVEISATSLRTKTVEVDMGVTYTTNYTFVKN